MSQSSGILSSSKPLYQSEPEWKSLATIGHLGIKSVFELRENGYNIINDLWRGAGSGRQKLYLIVTRAGIYAVRYLIKDRAIEVSRLADLNEDLLPEDRSLIEHQAQLDNARGGFILDCGLAVAGLVLGAYSGGVFLVIAGVAQFAKCGIATTKLWERANGNDASFFGSSSGKAIEIGVNVLSLTGGLGAAGKTAIKSVSHWQQAGKVMAPSLLNYYSKSFRLQLVKLLVVELPGLALTGNDLLSNYGQLSAMNLEAFLRHYEESGSSPPVQLLSIFQNPVDWFVDQFQQSLANPFRDAGGAR